ncbi:hypothetical protein HY492_02565 [Candidatus Woesearchaeota archaeon]|nr:hypothetical protein [Candidatus Woesearchaeota archaeon]
MKRLLFVVLLLFIGCAAQLDPLAVLHDANTKQTTTDYAAEYQTQSTMTIDGQPVTNDFRTTVIKSGTNKKTAVYADEIVLLSELYEHGNDKTLCTYGKTLADVQCAKLEKNTVDLSSILPALKETGLFTFTAIESKRTVDDQARACTLVEATFNPTALTPQGLEKLAKILGIEGETGAFPLKTLDAATCFDTLTGLALETMSTATFDIEGTALRTERSERITRITAPLIIEGTFSLPESAI